jgi:hypothetical protein
MWQDTIKMDLRELDSSDSGYGPEVSPQEHSNEPSGSKNIRKFLSSIVAAGFSRSIQLHVVR